MKLRFALFGLFLMGPNLYAQDRSPLAEAKWILERLTGVKWDGDSPVLKDVYQKLLANDRVGATEIATSQSQFYDITVKQVALPLSTREESLREPFNDFAATFIGVTRDNIDARQLLFGDFYYVADPAKLNGVAIRSNLELDILGSNNHYIDLQNSRLKSRDVLMRVDGQRILQGRNRIFNRTQTVVRRRVLLFDTVVGTGGQTSQVPRIDPATGQQAFQLEQVSSQSADVDVSTATLSSPNPDPAGVLTSQTFLGAHAIAGTNRRLVEFTFREFMCLPIERWADTGAPDLRIGRDIDRFPGGNHGIFLTTCKGCHTVMDGFRGAFAHWDARTDLNGAARAATHSRAQPLPANTTQQLSSNTTVTGDLETTVTVIQNSQNEGYLNNRDANGVVNKMNRNDFVMYSGGYVTTNDSFVNNATRGSNLTLLGWRGMAPDTSTFSSATAGVHAFGRLVANSQRFPRCMVKHVWNQVCRHDLPEADMEVVMASLGASFEQSGYNLRSLFQNVALFPKCRL